MVAALGNTISPGEARGLIRPVDTRRDLGAVADLVELCFKETLDPDSHSYLARMRAAARASRMLAWNADLPLQAPNTPVTGYVWEVEDHIVGNLSLIPFQMGQQKLTLIANVAVHPNFRQQGIARQLTSKALDYLKNQGKPAAWLHVRSDNPNAIHLYEKLGFEERARRTTWYNQDGSPLSTLPGELQITPRKPIDWPLQRRWLEEVYPARYSWHLPLDLQAMEASLRGDLYRFFSFTYPRHWVARRGSLLLGCISRLPADGYADALFLAVPKDVSAEVVQSLLVQARLASRRRKHLALNTPADLCPQAIRQAGFYDQQTLLWMEKTF
ncbi:MAG: GNAT family N-acetyltransferase [Anaerolineales bacterium]|jgi:ribosomal protein S18 acetylase RimI-like enzyme|nr:GNAT family N-acetyltransferase [Anaerolineales bacterium]